MDEYVQVNLDDNSGGFLVPPYMAGELKERLRMMVEDPERYHRESSERRLKLEKIEAEKIRVRNIWYNRIRIFAKDALIDVAYKIWPEYNDR